MKLIRRDFYLDRLKAVIGTPDIKVITGVRRCGKSKLMEMFINDVKDTVPDANVICVNFNLPRFESVMEYHALYDYIEKHFAEGKQNFVFIDEVQMCKGFEWAVNWLHATERYDIYITGSNAFLLGNDLATLFTGRTFEIQVFPFSLSEYMKYFELEDSQKALASYMTDGGMAGTYVYKSQQARYDYLLNVVNTLIVRDIQQKHKIRNVQCMDRLCDYMMDNVSNLFSARNAAKALELQYGNVSNKTIVNYIDYLCNAFAFYRVRRYDIQGKRYLSSTDKYYLCDHAFRYAKLGTKNMNYGRMLENVAAIELMRRGYEVYAGKLQGKEVDFVALKRSEKLYIQVSDDIGNEKTLEREAASLLQIKDAYPKLIIARTGHSEYQYDGVRILDAADWLCGR